ncbi:MAG: aldose epimerase family protein [Rikenellaceae bacterium]
MRKLFVALCVLVLGSCSVESESIQLLDAANFETMYDGKQVGLYTLHMGDITMQVTNFGARIVSLWVPDKMGQYDDIVLGYENIDRYLNNSGERFLGAVVGRYANRISKGEFTLDDQQYRLSTYNNGQCLHGGDKGFDMVVWDVVESSESKIVFRYVSPHMEEGFPGELTTIMTYSLSVDNELVIDYKATSDRSTVVNLSHHSFFNLKGEGAGTITDHELMIKGSAVTPIDKNLIPTGEILLVDNRPFDFREPKLIGADINSDDDQLAYGLGYDHNWIIDKTCDGVELVATLYEPSSGRFMEVFSDQVALQFYSGNFFDGTAKGKYETKHNYRESVALETQKYPDSPNHLHFPSTTLNEEDIYLHKCIYKFSIR